MKWSFWSSFEGTTTGTGLAVARTRGVLASLFAATRLSRAIQAPTRLGVDNCALALWTTGRALKKIATHGGHPVAALSRFSTRGVEREIGLTGPPCKKKFPPVPIFCTGVSTLLDCDSRQQRAAAIDMRGNAPYTARHRHKI